MSTKPKSSASELVGAKKRGRPRSSTATRDAEYPMINLRMPREMVADIDALGASAGIMNRSHVVRTLLAQVLYDEPARANVTQVIYDFNKIRIVLLRRLMRRFAEAAPGLLTGVLDEARRDKLDEEILG